MILSIHYFHLTIFLFMTTYFSQINIYIHIDGMICRSYVVNVMFDNDIIQLLPALAVNIIIVHPRSVVFPRAEQL